MTSKEDEVNKEQYDIDFGIARSPSDKKDTESERKECCNEIEKTKSYRAFVQVSDIRKFEIEMYWKRSAYFWALIVVAFTGYFAVMSAEKLPYRYTFSLMIAGLGFILSFAWYLSARGSKYWLENWENHLDLMEDEITGPLYKTVIQRPYLEGFAENYVTGPKAFSVSKINQWVTVAVGFTWIGLITISFIAGIRELNITLKIAIYISLHFIIILAIIFFCFLMHGKGKTHEDTKKPKAKRRSTNLK